MSLVFLMRIKSTHWKKVTEKVHQNNGLIFLQIWHVGRVSHPDFLGGKLPIGPSASVMTGAVYRSPGLTYGPSRAATLAEIKQLIDAYATAAHNAIKAGFDGVEIHGANGYLVDQFLHHHTNQREDDYGGNAENMARFALDVVKACGEIIGYERVGIRLSPGGIFKSNCRRSSRCRRLSKFIKFAESISHCLCSCR